MRHVTVFILALCLAAGWAFPKTSNRIIGGTVATINQHNFNVVAMYSNNLINYYHSCGATILTTTAVVSAAHCYLGDLVIRWQIRVGSSFASSGGVVHTLSRIINHPNYTNRDLDADVAILRTASAIVYNANVGPARIAGPAYNLADHQDVVVMGWGRTAENGPVSEQLRVVTVRTINQSLCSTRYVHLNSIVSWHVPTITAGMVCTGILDVGGRDACQGDSGGPVIHGGDVLYGITSWGAGCADAHYPGVNCRVSFYADWIGVNAVN